MWRGMTYGPKYTRWFVCYHDMAKHANKLWGLGSWTYEYKPQRRS